VRIEHIRRALPPPITIFDDTADPRLGHRECLCHDFDTTPAHHRFVIHGAVEFDYAAVRADGASFDATNTLVTLRVGNFNVGVATTLFFQDLESHVVRLRRLGIISVHLAIQVDCRSPGSLGLARQLQFF